MGDCKHEGYCHMVERGTRESCDDCPGPDWPEEPVVGETTCVHGIDMQQFCEECAKEVESRSISGVVTLIESDVISKNGYQDRTVVLRAKVRDGKAYEFFTHIRCIPNEKNNNTASYYSGHYCGMCIGSAVEDYGERCRKEGV